MRASVPCESSNRPGRQQQLPDCLADNNIARKYQTQALHPKTRINACNRPLHKIPTPQSASQNISKIADQFQYPPCTCYLHAVVVSSLHYRSRGSYVFFSYAVVGSESSSPWTFTFEVSHAVVCWKWSHGIIFGSVRILGDRTGFLQFGDLIVTVNAG